MMASLEGAVARFSAKNAFYVWSAVCVVACVWNYACAFCEYDLRLSSPHCVVLKGNSASDCTDVGSCLTPAQIQLLSPRWLGDIVALSGPAPVWLALGVWSLKSDDRRPMRALLALSMLLFVALVPATRHMLDWVGWEPSGHVLMYGLQLVPLFVTTEFHRDEVLKSPELLAAWAYAALLVYLTIPSAGFFHIPSHVVGGWAPSFLLLIGSLGLGAQMRSARVDASKRDRVGDVVQAQLMLLKGAVAVWATTSLAYLLARAVLDVRERPAFLLFLESAYDVVVIVAMHWLLTRGCAADMALKAHASPAPQRVRTDDAAESGSGAASPARLAAGVSGGALRARPPRPGDVGR